MKQSPKEYLFSLFIALLCFLYMGCEKTFINEAPFEMVQDTVFLDRDNWFYFSQEVVQRNKIPMFPFAYHIFDAIENGFLLKGKSQLFFLEHGKNPSEAYVFLDNQAAIGDTLSKFSDRHYHLLIDKVIDPKGTGYIYYVLRRSKKGVRTLEERSVWVLSFQKGLLAVSNHSIEDRTGVVTLDIVGDPNYFRNSEFIGKIKYYDFDRAYHVDWERSIIYTFEKNNGRLKSKNFEKGEELYEYRFKKGQMKELINFKIESSLDRIHLIAEDSCFIFNEFLELQYSRLCD